jgi:anthranilate/para-aminobenzoate synthase component II
MQNNYAKNLVEEIKQQLKKVKYHSLLYTAIDIKVNASEDYKVIIIEIQKFAKDNYDSVYPILGISLTNQIKNYRYVFNTSA